MHKDRLVQVRFTEEERQLLELLVNKGFYYTISDAVADGVRQLAARRRMKQLPRPRPRPPRPNEQLPLFRRKKAVE